VFDLSAPHCAVAFERSDTVGGALNCA